MASNKDLKRLSGLINTIKIEPGTSANPGRLPSFRGARDLTLGGLTQGKPNTSDSKQKKVYKPNLNVQRNKNKEDAGTSNEHPKGRENKRGRGRDSKNTRTPRNSNYVQSTGSIFAEGIAAAEKKRGVRASYGGDKDNESTFIPKPKLNLQYDRKFDKEEDEQKLKELLRDDFIDDPVASDASFAPVELPLLKKENIKEEIKTEPKCEIKQEIDIESVSSKIKKEKLDEESGNVNVDFRPLHDASACGLELQELFSSKEPQLIFLQLPDCLPGLKPEDSTGVARPSTSARPSTVARPSTSAAPSTQQQTVAQADEKCSLKDLSEGLVGKVQLLKSGRARLVLGDTVLNLEMGTQLGFRQDVVCVNLESSTHGGDMINLGPVGTRLVCAPDLETMLATSKA